MTSISDELLEEFERKVGHRFTDRTLARTALTHSSAKGQLGVSNERLEFLGDAIVNAVAADILFRRYPDASEGDLAQLRSRVVSEPAFARLARRLELGKYILLGRGEEKAGGRTRNSLLSDVFEALVGAVYVDSGYGVAHAFVARWIIDSIEELDTHESPDYKSQLQEIVQQRERRLPRYRISGQEGPDHDRAFVAVVELGGRVVGKGKGRSKKEAEQAAAESALRRYQGS